MDVAVGGEWAVSGRWGACAVWRNNVVGGYRGMRANVRSARLLGGAQEQVGNGGTVNRRDSRYTSHC